MKWGSTKMGFGADITIQQMSALSIIAEIEQQVSGLTTDEQWQVVEMLLRRLRPRASRPNWDADLAAMAADPDIQREIKGINEEL